MVYCRNCGESLQDEALYCTKCGAAVDSKQNPTQVSPAQSSYQSPIAPQIKLATWGERFVAWLIDSIIIGAFAAAISVFSSFNWVPLSFWPNWIPFFNISLSSLFSLLYWIIMDANYGQSLGKMIMHIKIAQLDGSPVKMGSAVIESVGKAFLLPLDLIIGLILYPKKQQRLFNYASETIVMHE